MPLSSFDDSGPVRDQCEVGVEDQAADTSARERLDHAVDVSGASDLKPVYPKAEIRCRPLDRADASGGGSGSRIPDHRDAPGGPDFAQQLDPLAGDAIVEES